MVWESPCFRIATLKRSVLQNDAPESSAYGMQDWEVSERRT